MKMKKLISKLLLTLSPAIIPVTLALFVPAQSYAATYTCGGSACNLLNDNSSLANFQAWTGMIHNAFIALGWVQTSDTGQTVPSAAGAVPTNSWLYVIYKANDALASTMPIYVKFEYGYSSTCPATRWTFGTGSNGTGTITNPLSNSPWGGNADCTNYGTTTFPAFFSGSGGEFRMFMGETTVTSTKSGKLVVIERSKSSSGSDTGDYFTGFALDQMGACNQHGAQSESSTLLYGFSSYPIVTTASDSGTMYSQGTVAAMPVFPWTGVLGNPMLGLMTAVAADVTNGSTVTVASAYGATHTYIAVTGPFGTQCGSGGNNVSVAAGTRIAFSSVMAFLMRYE